MSKQRLFTPGPTMVPEEVQIEIARPVDHHRTPEYKALLEKVTKGLQYVFRTESPVVTMAGSGTSGMEAAIVSCAAPGRKALVALGGKFAERWAKVCQTHDIEHTDIELEWGRAVDPDQIAAHLRQDPQIGMVVVTHSETSAATACDLQAIAAATRESPALLVVDGITAVGALPLEMDDWGVDVVVTGSQKALMLPPGLAFAAVGPRARRIIESAKPGSFYLNLGAYLKSLEKWDAPYTPANTLIRGLAKSLEMIQAEGIEAVWARTAKLAAATRAAAEALNLRVFSSSPSDSVTAIVVPDGVDEGALRKTLLKDYGCRVAGGQEHLKGKIFRISHMGYVDAVDTLGVIAALEQVLVAMGHTCRLGAGLAAAQQVLAAR